MTPQAMAFTAIWLGAYSLARAFVRPFMPDLVAEWAASQEAPQVPHMEEMLIMCPDLAETMSFKAALEQ